MDGYVCRRQDIAEELTIVEIIPARKVPEKELVNNYQWLEESEFLDIIGVSELFLGAISIKFAADTGYKVAGVPGIIVANCANLLPPLILMLLVSMIYAKYKHIGVFKGALEMACYAMITMIVGIAIING